MLKRKIYDPKAIESKWRKLWEELSLYKTSDGQERPSTYVLGMFPYPSGEGLHVGHLRVFAAVDVMSRYLRMRGKKVLMPMGWDSFGLPAENAAIKRKTNPMDMVPKNEANFKRQFELVGVSYDWDRCFSTTDPKYYKWTQWLFLQLYSLKNDKGERLIYRKETPINWCPFCKTGLANEEVLSDGTHERCGAKVEQKLMPQWMMRITDYADRLLNDLMYYEWVDEDGNERKGLDWPKGILEMQKNWIGKDRGLEIFFELSNGQRLPVWTKFYETIFGATFLVVAPELVKEWTESGLELSGEVMDYVTASLSRTTQGRLEGAKDKTGVDTGLTVKNPTTGEDVPVWVADYVLANVGSGAVMGVPSHDERDFDFAKKYSLKMKQVVKYEDREINEAVSRGTRSHEEDGILINSGEFDGLPAWGEGKKKIAEWLVGQKWATEKTNYHLRDWIFSRQRYWGEPFPLIYCSKCGDENGVVLVPEDQLPVTLPYLEQYEPSGTGESPLVAASEWVEVNCPKCGEKARRETDTMPNWAGSCWYFLYFALNGAEMRTAGEKSGDLKKQWEEIFRPKLENWLPVNWYLGGAEHAVLHLLYARFWTKAFYDLELITFEEPFLRLRDRGTILADDGRKMSKSWGNVVNPDDMVARFGADALRVYEMFMGPWGQAIAWDTRSLVGCYRFMEKIYKLSFENVTGTSELKLAAALNKLVKKVGEDITTQKFNTSIAGMMEFANAWSKSQLSQDDLKRFLKILAPFAPFITEEIWSNLGEKTSIHFSAWPEAVEVEDETVKMVVQVNGRTREVFEMDKDGSRIETEVLEKVRGNEKVNKWLKGGEKTVFVPGRLVNFVSREIPS